MELGDQHSAVVSQTQLQLHDAFITHISFSSVLFAVLKTKLDTAFRNELLGPYCGSFQYISDRGDNVYSCC